MLASRVLFDGNQRAIGVSVTQNGATRQFMANARSDPVGGRGRYAEAAATLRRRRQRIAREASHRDGQGTARCRPESAGPSVRELLLSREREDAERRNAPAARQAQARPAVSADAQGTARDEREPVGRILQGQRSASAAESAAVLQSAVVPDSEEQQGESRTRAVFGLSAGVQSVPADEPRFDRDRVEPRGRRREDPHQRADDGKGYRRSDPGLRTGAQGDGGAGVEGRSRSRKSRRGRR